jgi:hypothetical protein
MAALIELLPEYREASAISRALHRLREYYAQSNGKAAKALSAKIITGYVFAAGNHTYGPDFLAPFNAAYKAAESEETRDFRLHYWTGTLRPLLDDSEFISSLSKVTLRIKDARVTAEDRDKAIEALRHGLAYFDGHFGTGGGGGGSSK